MRRKTIKLREFPLGNCKVNSTYIGNNQTFFVVGDSGNNVRLYTFESEEEIQIYNNHNNQAVQTEVTAVALSCLEKEIFSGSNRGMINVWDMQTAKQNVPLKGHSTAVNCFGIYPQQPSKLASGSYDTTVKLWDIREKNCTATLKGHSKPINSIAISPDGNMLLSGSEDNTARLWELRMPQRQIYVSNEHNGPIVKVKFNHQDCMFATCSMDKTAKYFRCEEKCYGFASSTDLVATPVTAIGFSEDGKTLFTASNEGLKSWNMYKNGLLLESFQTSWKGVQEMTMMKQALMAIAFTGSMLSLWVCDVNSKIKNSSRQFGEESSFVLPKIGKNYGKQKEEFNLNELQNIVGMAVQKVNNIQDKPTRDVDKKQQFQKRKQQMQRKREEMERKKKEEEKRQKQFEEERERQKERILLQKLLKQKEQRQQKQRQRVKKLDEQRRQQERLYQQRLERQKAIQQKVMQTFQNHNNFQNTLQNDLLQDSTVMNISTYIADGAQKQKLKQVELIGQILKDNSKFQSVLKQRSNSIKPIINFWRQGRITTALDLIVQSNSVIMIDTTTAILNTPIFKQAITPEVGVALTSCLKELMITNKHSTHVKASMMNLTTIVMLFKDQLIKIKTFNPLTRVDISRQERLAKYDRLIDEFLNVFRQQRLKKYYQKKKAGDEDMLCVTAYGLYKILEEVLIKILPAKQQQPELV